MAYHAARDEDERYNYEANLEEVKKRYCESDFVPYMVDFLYAGEKWTCGTIVPPS